MDMEREFEESSGNIFKDLGVSDPILEDMKAQLALKIFIIIKQKNQNLVREGKRKLTQAQIGKLFGIEQPEISKLKNGQYSRFSLERLLYFLNRLHYNVDINLSPARREQPHQTVTLWDPNKNNNSERSAHF